MATHHSLSTLKVPAAALCLAALVPSQDPLPGRALPLNRADLRVPIHTLQVDPSVPPYGIWAAGPEYKASFHDGFAFYPYRGPDADPVALHWRTASVMVGGHDLIAGDSPASRHTDWRFELDYGAVIEAYDVLLDGVEQTFTVTERPSRAGDLVVTGRIETDLTADHVTGVHDALRFADGDGRPAIEYGAAIAIDAGGRRTEMTTTHDGTEISLTLAGSWLRDAVFPVVIDPITAPSVLNVGTALEVNHIDVARLNNGIDEETAVVFSRRFSGGDVDTYGFVFDYKLTYSRLMWADLSANWSSLHPSVAFCGPDVPGLSQGEWIVTWHRKYYNSQTFPEQVMIYIQATQSTLLNGGKTEALTDPVPGTKMTNPEVGGMIGSFAGEERFVVVYERRAPLKLPEVQYAVFRAFGSPTLVFGPAVLQPLPRLEVAHLSVSTSFEGEWMAVWHEQGAGSDFVIAGTKVTAGGSVLDTVALGGSATPGVDKLNPYVEGIDGSFMVCFDLEAFPSPAIRVQRVVWPAGTPYPFQIKTPRTLATGNALTGTPVSIAALEVDPRPQYSHWAVAYRRGASELRIARLGRTGEVAETLLARTSSTGFGAVGLAGPGRYNAPRFLLVSTDPVSRGSIWAQNFEYNPAAQTATYGNGCGGVIAAPVMPYAGTADFPIQLQQGAPNKPAALLFAAGPAAIPLTFAPGCALNLDPTLIVPAPAPTDGGGTAEVRVNLPTLPGSVGDFCCQWFHVDVFGALKATEGLLVQVR